MAFMDDVRVNILLNGRTVQSVTSSMSSFVAVLRGDGSLSFGGICFKGEEFQVRIEPVRFRPHGWREKLAAWLMKDK